jgi:CRISPR-associated protein Csm2
MNSSYSNRQHGQGQNQGRYGGQNRDSSGSLSEEILKKIVWTGDSKTLVEEAEKLGARFCKSLTTSQIRAIFSEMRQIEGMSQIPEQKDAAYRRLYLLKPKMKYRAGKEGRAVKELVDGVLDPALTLVFAESSKQGERFKNFAQFFEAILAYHKYNGGK